MSMRWHCDRCDSESKTHLCSSAVYYDGEEYELCNECEESFRAWLRAPRNNEESEGDA